MHLEQNDDRYVNSKGCVHEVSDGNKDLLGTGLEAIHVIVWQISCLYFICVPILCGSLTLM